MWSKNDCITIKSLLFPNNNDKNAPNRVHLVNDRRKLYYYSKEPSQFLMMQMPTIKSVDFLNIKLSSDFNVCGQKNIRFILHEGDTRIFTPTIRLMNIKKLPSIGWITISNFRSVSIQRKSTNIKRELKCEYINVNKCESKIDPLIPKILSFDIEAYSNVYNAMCNSSKPTDEVFQISAVIPAFRNDPDRIILFTLKHSDPIQRCVPVEIRKYNTERELLCNFSKFIRDEQFNIVIGYNINGWDIRYMIRSISFIKM